MIILSLHYSYAELPKKNNQENMTDVPWRWWPGNTFEEEWHATSKACGARAEVLKKYFPKACLSQYLNSRLLDVELPKTKSSNPNAQLMFCYSQFLNRQDHCHGFTYCVEHTHDTGQRFWFCDDCSKCYHERVSQGKNMYQNEDEEGEWTIVETFDPDRHIPISE